MFDYIGRWTIENLTDQILTDLTVTKGFATSQLIFSNVAPGLKGKERVIQKALEEIKNKDHLQTAFLTTVDIMTNENLLFCSDDFGKNLISKALGVQFEGPWARRSPALLRKQIMPLIKNLL